MNGPVFTYALIGLNVVVSLFGFLALRDPRRRGMFLFIPSRASDNLVGTLLSHFSHGDIWHLLVNMIALYYFGPPVEELLGAGPYLAIYAISGVGSTLAIYVLRRNNPRHAALGASGSIAGVLFASAVVAPATSVYLLFIPIPIPAPVFAVVYLVLSSVMIGGEGKVSHEAHVGGAVTGFILAAVMYEHGLGPFIRAITGLLG